MPIEGNRTGIEGNRTGVDRTRALRRNVPFLSMADAARKGFVVNGRIKLARGPRPPALCASFSLPPGILCPADLNREDSTRGKIASLKIARDGSALLRSPTSAQRPWHLLLPPNLVVSPRIYQRFTPAPLPPAQSGDAWKDISGAGKSLVLRLLDLDSSKRPSAAEALAHRWSTADETMLPRAALGAVQARSRLAARAAARIP